MISRRLAFAALLGVCACRGTVPERNAPPEQAISAILVGCRLLTPSGEALGEVALNFESEGGRQAEVYRLPLRGGENYLYLVEPGVYRLAPTRALFGAHQPELSVVIEGRTYRLPFPRELLRHRAYEIRPSKIVPLGIVEARLLPSTPGQEPAVRLRLDDGVEARRSVVQTAIRDMMDPRRSSEARESAIAWSRSLQNSLMELLSEEERRPTFKAP